MGSMQLPPPAEAQPAADPATHLSTVADGSSALLSSALLRGFQGAEGEGGAASSPFDIQLPSMRLAPRASSQAPTSPTHASPVKVGVKAAPALFSPMVTAPRDYAYSPESEPEPNPPPLPTPPRSAAARAVSAASTAAGGASGGASPRVAWGQWGARSAMETKVGPAPMPLTPAHAATQPYHQQRPPQRGPATSLTASPAPFASPPSLGARPTGRHVAAPSSLMGAPMRVCKPSAVPSASPFVAPLAPASYAGVTPPTASEASYAGLAIAEAILATAAAAEAPPQQQMQDDAEADTLAAAGRVGGRNCGGEQRSSAGVLQAYYDEMELQQSSRAHRARA